MFDIGFGELLVLGVLALFVFGPERLPKVAAQAARALRDARTMAHCWLGRKPTGLTSVASTEYRDAFLSS